MNCVLIVTLVTMISLFGDVIGGYYDGETCHCDCNCAPVIEITERCCDKDGHTIMPPPTTMPPPTPTTTTSTTTTTTTPPPTTTACTEPYGHVDGLGCVFLDMETSKSHSEADDECPGDGGLLEIDDQDTLDAIKIWLRNTVMSGPASQVVGEKQAPLTDSCWVAGLVAENGDWVNAAGAQLEFIATVIGTANGPDVCVSFNDAELGQFSCAELRPFICQPFVTAPPPFSRK